MRDMTHSPDLKLLGLDEAGPLFDALPRGVNGPAIVAALMAALQEATATAKPPLTETQRIKIVSNAAQALLRGGPRGPNNALHLAASLPPEIADTVALANIRLVALSRLGDQVALKREINRLAGLVPLKRPMAELLIRFADREDIRQLIVLPAAHHDLAWGKLEPELRDKVPDLARLTPSPAIPDETLHYVYDRSESGIDDFEAFRLRLQLGVNLGRYAHYLRARSAQVMRNLAKAAPRDKIVVQLWKQVRSARTCPDLPQILADHDPTRSFLLLGAHAGVNALVASTVHEVGLPVSIVANQPIPDTNGAFNVSTLAPDATLRFTKLTKMAKKSPRAIFMYPDGNSGDQVTVGVMGAPARVGKGAGTLAYFTRAVPYFTWTELNEDHIVIRLRRGPAYDGQEEKEEFEARVIEFYAECLTDLLKGAPENIGALIHKIKPLT